MLINCDHCSVQFNRKPSEINLNNFCCRNCASVAREQGKFIGMNYKGKIFSCGACKKDVYVVPSKFNRSQHFCSNKCHGDWNSLNLIGSMASNYKGGKRKSRCQFCDSVYETYSNMKYCCNKCKFNSQKIINVLNCLYCSKEVIRCDSKIFWSNVRSCHKSFCSTDCSVSYHKGENNANWRTDRSKLKSENRSLRYSTKMKEWRKCVFERDNYTCFNCKNRSSKCNPVTLNAHHIKRFADFPDLRFDVTNGITLCKDCHNEVTNKELFYENQFFEYTKSKKII